MRTNETKTAAEAYKERSADISILIDCISMELDAHETRAASEPRNWGHAGDLSNIRQKLTETLQFLMGGDEDESLQSITEHLAAMRDDRKPKGRA